MLIPLDLVTRNKLILVKQLYQRALIQSQFTHRFVDRMLSVVGFDLANETVLKAIAVALNQTIKLKHSFPDVIKQVNDELGKNSKTLPDVIKIQKVHDLRNATQHHARYPTEIEVSDSRTYTRDFLEKVFFDVWGESFESISLVDAIKDEDAKNYLKEAEEHLEKSEIQELIIKSKAAFEIILGGIANRITESFSNRVNSFVVSDGFDRTEQNRDIFTTFKKMRDLIAFQSVGINSQEYLKYKRLTQFVLLDVSGKKIQTVKTKGVVPSKEQAEYVINFVINSIIQIESLDDDVLNVNEKFI